MIPCSLSFQEVWDKDILTQERMGQLGFTTEKLKDLGKVRDNNGKVHFFSPRLYGNFAQHTPSKNLTSEVFTLVKLKLSGKTLMNKCTRGIYMATSFRFFVHKAFSKSTEKKPKRDDVCKDGVKG